MDLQLQGIYHGFKLLEEKKIKEIDSKAYLFIHEKSGAKLFYLENEDDNKVFSITFRTPPKDSTGVAHILEHSVLCGSRKFPTKEPFVELAKGSLNTFLNAMTFSDKTMYPIASKNEKDFRNLMDVYLDSVLHPNLYNKPETLMQEGWHYELENREDEITYKGVVYNEMKGAFSSPESLLFRKIQESLFPDTPYGVESGGDPEVIPELTQEQFIDFHKKYYHPSNSFIYLYGDLNLLDELKFIDDAYLREYEKINVDSQIPMQKTFEEKKEILVSYPISPNEKEEEKTFLSLNYVINTSLDKETYLAFDILEHLLLDTSAAPLKKALIDANLGKDVFGAFDNSILQPVFSIVVKNANEEDKDKFEKIVRNTLEKLVREGIDKKLVESSINIKEFNMREADFGGYPKGLIYGIRCMDTWLYGENPTIHLEYEETLKRIKTALNEPYFERLIEKYLLNNTHSTKLIVKPEKGLDEKKAQEVRRKLIEYKASLKEEEIEKLIQQTRQLKEKQTTPDTREALESIPLLSLEDVEKKAEKLPLEVKKIKDIEVLHHPIFTSNIAYVNLYFDASKVPQDLLQYVGLLIGVIGDVATKKYTYEELSNEINIHTGGIHHTVEVYGESNLDEVYYPKLIFKSKALVEKLPKLMELLGEQIEHSQYDDKKRLKEIIQEIKSRLEMIMFQQGHIVSQTRVASYFSSAGKYIENTKGLSFYHFISDIEKNFEQKSDKIIKSLIEVTRCIFNKENLIISITADSKDYSKFEDCFDILYSSLGKNKKISEKYEFKFGPDNEGLMTSGKVQYVAKSYNFKKLGYKYNGSLQVAKTIVGRDYLWNQVRVLGGAYGAFVKLERNGNLSFISYRDPNLNQTMKTYDGVGEYLRNLQVDEREMTKYILGTIRDLDLPLSPANKGEKAAIYYLKHLKEEDIQKEREEILNTKVEDIRKFSALFEDVMKQDYICVMGNEEKIKQEQEMFKNIINIFE